MYTVNDLFEKFGHVFGHLHFISDIEFAMNDDGTFSDAKYYENAEHYQTMYAMTTGKAISEYNSIKKTYSIIPALNSVWHNQAVAYRAYCDWMLERSGKNDVTNLAESKLMIRSMLKRILRSIRSFCVTIIRGDTMTRDNIEIKFSEIVVTVFPYNIVIVKSDESSKSGVHMLCEERILSIVSVFGCMMKSVITNTTSMRPGFAPFVDMFPIGPQVMLEMQNRTIDDQLEWKHLKDAPNVLTIRTAFECAQYFVLALSNIVKLIIKTDSVNPDCHIDFNDLHEFLKDTHRLVIDECGTYVQSKMAIPIINFGKAIAFYKQAEL